MASLLDGSSGASSNTKELLVHSGDYQCMVDVSATDTMFDVRQKVLEEFDDDMLPNHSRDFYIAITKTRLSSKQETKKLAFGVLAAGHTVSLQTKATKRAATTEEDSINQKEEGPPLKKVRNNVNDKENDMENDMENDNQATEVDNNSEEQSMQNGTAKAYATPAAQKFSAERIAIDHEESVEMPSETLASYDSKNSFRSNDSGKETDIVDVDMENSNEAFKEANLSSSEGTSEVEVAKVTNSPENPHEKYDNAVGKSKDLLRSLNNILQNPDNENFCSVKLRNEWVKEITASLNSTPPDTTIGCLGSTGVGKSSLLNALLDEAAVLPTSGSRGCTAAVVELKFNRELFEPEGETTVYKGQVEFMSLPDWLAELKVLIDECSTHESQTIYVMAPQEQNQPEAAAAWAKIDQVYGRGTMSSLSGRPKSQAWNRLSRDSRIVRLLTTEHGGPHTIMVSEGIANKEECKALLGPLSKLRGKLGRFQKRWANSFRNKINDYVYRKGNGSQPQTWPLIRKVVLHGPWAVLSTGACLVDLPGVRDANAARAKVAETYLQNCDQIWIVAPIKRAVDDGTAKELLGEQFKRRLLMDGQYGNVSFICTQTDDCETTEIMRDHEDVAKRVEGRWERMNDLLDQINAIDRERSEMAQQEDDLKVELEEADQSIEDLEAEINELKADLATTDYEGDSDQTLHSMEVELKAKKRNRSAIFERISDWRENNVDKMQGLQEKSRGRQRTLKAMASLIRNEYSTKCLQDDFRSGLEELTQKPQDGEEDDPTAPRERPRDGALPNNYQLEVHCVASNDYLKIQGVKPATDGPPNTFARPEDTQIPSLREAVHNTTAVCRAAFATNFVNTASDMLDRIKLCATEDREDSNCGHLLRQAFEKTMKGLESKVTPVVSEFVQNSETKVKTCLKPSIQKGAATGKASALSTVTSWGSSSRRTRHERRPDKNGLFWSTYNATVRREGVYVSTAAGEINMNQELCDPIEKEFSSDWERIMNTYFRTAILRVEQKIGEIFANVAREIVVAFTKLGMEKPRLNATAQSANRACTTALKNAFQQMREVATSSQRDLNRSLLPKVQARMKSSYTAALSVPRGTGTFNRMKNAMSSETGQVVATMFSEAIDELLGAIGSLIKQLASMILASAKVIDKSLASVYSVCWDGQPNQFVAMDPAMQEKVRTCRNALLPELNSLRESQNANMEILGIEREQEELVVEGVETWEETKAKELHEAKNQGNYFELLDSDDEEDEMDTKPPAAPAARVKSEPSTSTNLFGSSRVTPPKYASL